MCVCVKEREFVCLRVYVSTCTCVYISKYVCVCTYVCTYTYICHTHMYTYMRTYIHPHIHSYIHTFIHSYMHIYIPTYMHTYIHRDSTNARPIGAVVNVTQVNLLFICVHINSWCSTAHIYAYTRTYTHSYIHSSQQHIYDYAIICINICTRGFYKYNHVITFIHTYTQELNWYSSHQSYSSRVCMSVYVCIYMNVFVHIYVWLYLYIHMSCIYTAIPQMLSPSELLSSSRNLQQPHSFNNLSGQGGCFISNETERFIFNEIKHICIKYNFIRNDLHIYIPYF